MLICETNFEKARKRIRENKENEIIFCGDDETNRKVLEKEQINILLLNQKSRKDRQKQRESGFNQVMAKLAKKKDVVIGINFDEIIESHEREREKIIARIKQNIRICNKHNLKMKFITQNSKNKRDKYDLKALGIILGMPTKMVKTL